MNAEARWIAAHAVVVVLFARPALGDGVEFRSERSGYSLTLPDGWVRIPQEMVEEVKAVMFSGEGAQIEYDAAFQRGESAGWFTYPYLIVQVVRYEKEGVKRQLYESEFADVAKDLTNLDVEEVVDQVVQPEFGEMLSESSVSAARLDVAGRQLTWSVKMNAEGIGEVVGNIFGHFGRNALVQVMYYSMADELPLYESDFVESAGSFQFDSDNEYDDSLAAAPKYPGPSGASLIGVVVVTMAIVASRRRRRKSKSMSA